MRLVWISVGLALVLALPFLVWGNAGMFTPEGAVAWLRDFGQWAWLAGNTASRIQSAAEPGTVLVGETTRRASEAAIAYADAGEHELKGKAEPLHLWQALRVAAQRRGEGRSVGLEAPRLRSCD